MDYAEPTHTITHTDPYTDTRTIARVPLTERIHPRLDSGTPLDEGDRKYVAMRFKNTTPIAGPDMSDEYVDYDNLSIKRILQGPVDPEYGEAPVHMGPGGVVLD